MDNNKDENKLGRRQFFGFVWIVALVALFAQVGYGLFKFMTPVLEEGAFGTVVKAGRMNDFEVGSGDGGHVDLVDRSGDELGEAAGEGNLARDGHCSRGRDHVLLGHAAV